MTRVEVKPEFFHWAIRRARLEADDLATRVPKLEEWMTGEARPTFKQLEKFAATTHAPLGFFFLPEPSRETMPAADLRVETLGSVSKYPRISSHRATGSRIASRSVKSSLS